MVESPDGETPVIVGMADAAMHMYEAAIEALPDSGDPEYPERAEVVLAGLRKLQNSLAEAASRSRATPSVIVALSGVRSRYDGLMAEAAAGPYPTLGQRLYVARQRAKLSSAEAANAVGLRAELIESVEAGEQPTSGEEARIAELLNGLDGGPSTVVRDTRAAAVPVEPTVVHQAVHEVPPAREDDGFDAEVEADAENSNEEESEPAGLPA